MASAAWAQIRVGLICLNGVLPAVDYLRPLPLLFFLIGVAAALVEPQGR